jgi:hypothetical protein
MLTLPQDSRQAILSAPTRAGTEDLMRGVSLGMGASALALPLSNRPGSSPHERTVAGTARAKSCGRDILRLHADSAQRRWSGWPCSCLLRNIATLASICDCSLGLTAHLEYSGSLRRNIGRRLKLGLWRHACSVWKSTYLEGDVAQRGLSSRNA